MVKPYYSHGGITIYHGDCLEIMPELEPVDLVLTDPPYGISHPTDYRSRARGKWSVCHNYPPVHGDNNPFDPNPLLNKSEAICLWGANYYCDKLPTTSGWLVWDKERPHLLDQATAELAWTNFIKGIRVFRHLWNGMQRDSELNAFFHPMQKPKALMKWVLTLKWTPQGTILDPYMGCGPVLVAAKELNRKAIGIEIEEKYCEIAARRLSQEVFQF